jgi:hypothetical protein
MILLQGEIFLVQQNQASKLSEVELIDAAKQSGRR